MLVVGNVDILNTHKRNHRKTKKRGYSIGENKRRLNVRQRQLAKRRKIDEAER